jgi:hypothetical protein
MSCIAVEDSCWGRLSAMTLDELDAVLPFSKRLARENGWEASYAERVVEEYKRFLYLSVAQSGPLTPSDPVDQAWHLHLTYSEHYWNYLCKYVLGEPLHHRPTRGGASDTRKYRQCYARTLELYCESFDELPPEDVWPDVEARFADGDGFRRIDTATHLVIPLPRALREPGVLVPVALALGATGCAVGMDGEGLGFGDIVLLVGFVWLVRFIVKSYMSGGGRGGGSGCGSGCGGGCGS